MSKQFPDFAKSTNVDVLESVRETYRRRKEFFAKLKEVSKKYTGVENAGFYSGSTFESMHMSGIGRAYVEDVSKLPGQWKKPDRGVLKPYKNNLVVTADFSIGYKAADIPGRGNLVWGHGRLGTGVLFEFEGAIYSHFGFERFDMTETVAAEAEEFGWTEILASEYYKAKEGRQAQLDMEAAS